MIMRYGAAPHYRGTAGCGLRTKAAKHGGYVAQYL
jgi:hypothetical protein